MTPEEALEALREIVSWQRMESRDTDWETDHVKADEVLTALLRHLGHADVADAFDAIGKWYA